MVEGEYIGPTLEELEASLAKAKQTWTVHIQTAHRNARVLPTTCHECGSRRAAVEGYSELIADTKRLQGRNRRR